MFNDDVKNFINKNKNINIKYILLSVTWDEQMKFEVQKDRLRGGPTIDNTEFNHLKDYVKQLDNFALVLRLSWDFEYVNFLTLYCY